MLQKRRLYDSLNTILNYAMLVYLLISIIYGLSFYLKMKTSFVNAMSSFVGVLGWIITLTSIIQIVIGLLIIPKDRQFKKARLIWAFLRMIIVIVLTLFFSFTGQLVTEGIVISI